MDSDSRFISSLRNSAHWGFFVKILGAVAPGLLALFVPFVLLRLASLPRALVFNPSLNSSMLRHSIPALFADDVLFAGLGGLVIALLGWARKDKGWRRWIPRSAQFAVLVAATVMSTTQYRVYAEIGMVPSAIVFRRFLRPGGPFLASTEFILNLETLGWVLFAVVVPWLVFRLAERFRRVGLAVTSTAVALMFVGWLWSVAPPVTAVMQHPFRKLARADFELPTPKDPEVTKEPPDFRSISGLSYRDRCRSYVERVPNGNLIVVILESTAAQYLYENGKWRYPNLRRMAANALHFPHYYSGAGRSNPAVHMLLTSRYLNPNDAWWETVGEQPEPSLSRHLGLRDYKTGFFLSGCFKFFFDGPLFTGLGWDVCQDGNVLASLYQIPWEQREQRGGCIDDKQLIDHCVKWIDTSRKEQRRFLSVIYPGVPHVPYTFCAKGPHAIHIGDNLTARQLYENQLAYIDIQLGRLYDHLVKVGFFENGFLVITGDHGEAFSQHPGNVIHGADVYEENLRVPLLIVNPRRIQSFVCRTPGSHVDLAPTLLDLVGVSPDSGMEGVSLLSDEGPAMVFLITTLDAVSFGLVDGPYKYIYRVLEERSELYRLDDDPGELDDLAQREHELVRKYRSWVKSFVYHTLTPTPIRNATPAEQEYYEGRRLLNRGRPSAAIWHFRNALRTRMDYPEAREQLGSCYFEIGLDRMRYSRWDQAVSQFREAVRILPDRADVHAACSDALVRVGEYQQAIQTLRDVPVNISQDSRIELRLAWLLATVPDESIRTPAEALQLIGRLSDDLSQSSPVELDVCAVVFAANDRYEKAIELTEQAIAGHGPEGNDDYQADLTVRLEAYRSAELPAFKPYPKPIRTDGG